MMASGPVYNANGPDVVNGAAKVTDGGEPIKVEESSFNQFDTKQALECILQEMKLMNEYLKEIIGDDLR